MARAALSTAFAGLSGTLGDLTIVQRPDGPVVRARVYRPRTLTPAQQESAARLAAVSQAWKALDDTTYAAWVAYSQTQEWRNLVSGAIVTPAPYNLFSKLASKVRQIDPTVSLDGFMPPAQMFGGDGVLVEVSPPDTPSFRSGERKGTGDGEREIGGLSESFPEVATTPSPTVPPSARDERCVTDETATPRLQGEPSLVFSADRPNAPGTVTELLIQPLANARRAVYNDKYVSRGFVAFGEGSLEATVPVEPGAYACAIRFVREATGQETEIVPLGVVSVA